MRPGNTIAMYWSEVTTLTPEQVPTTTATSVPGDGLARSGDREDPHARPRHR
jgi:hypothetical protein